jgi:hypothetical protein
MGLKLFLTLSEDRALGIFENRALRRTFGPKRGKYGRPQCGFVDVVLSCDAMWALRYTPTFRKKQP